MPHQRLAVLPQEILFLGIPALTRASEQGCQVQWMLPTRTASPPPEGDRDTVDSIPLDGA